MCAAAQLLDRLPTLLGFLRPRFALAGWHALRELESGTHTPEVGFEQDLGRDERLATLTAQRRPRRRP